MASRQSRLHPVIATAVALNLFVLVLAWVWARSDTAALGRLLIEDGLVEWMQFLAFAVIAMVLAFVGMERWRRTKKLSLDLVGIAGLSLLVAVAAFEEISWFQRVIGVSTPEFFEKHNRQGETNLHKLALGSASQHKTVLLKLIFIAGLLHNLVLPLLARSRPVIREKIEALGMYLPPLHAALMYLLLVLLSHLLIDHPRKGELGEMFGAVHYLATVITAYLFGVGYGKPPVFEHEPDRRRLARLAVPAMGFLLLVSWLLGAMSLRVVG